MENAEHCANQKTNIQQAVEVWIDATSIVYLGIALDYHKLRSAVQEEVGKDFQARYYSHYLKEKLLESPTNKTVDRNKIANRPGKQLQQWVQREQQHAEDAGFALRLSSPWQERVCCMYCSCLNTVQFPTPALLQLQSDLLQLFYEHEMPPMVYLLSNNVALLKNIFQGPFAHKLQLIALDDSLAADMLKEVRQKAAILQLDSEQVEWEDSADTP